MGYKNRREDAVFDKGYSKKGLAKQDSRIIASSSYRIVHVNMHKKVSSHTGVSFGEIMRMLFILIQVVFEKRVMSKKLL